MTYAFFFRISEYDTFYGSYDLITLLLPFPFNIIRPIIIRCKNSWKLDISTTCLKTVLPGGVLNFGLGRGVPLGILKCHHPSPIPILKEKWPIHVPRYMRSGPSMYHGVQFLTTHTCTCWKNSPMKPWRYQNKAKITTHRGTSKKFRPMHVPTRIHCEIKETWQTWADWAIKI